MTMTQGYAAQSATSPLAPFSFERRDPGPRDVQIEILFCGVCHSDLHHARNEWQGTTYPCVPGHEIVGRVTKVGRRVKKLKEGDIAAVGCMVGSCRTCPSCKKGLEQYCEKGAVYTYNSPDPLAPRAASGEEADAGGAPPAVMTYGGYSESIVVDKGFALKVPKGMPLAETAPLLCAGIMTYSPLRHWKIGRRSRVGVVGLGGLGHMAVKLARAMGAHVVLFTTSASKVADGARLGAHEVVISTDAEAMSSQKNSLDFILDTVSAPHDLGAYLRLLRRDGAMVLVGLPGAPLPVEVFHLVMRRAQLGGSSIGGIPETQEMLDFCAEHGIASEIELIGLAQINEAYDRLLRNDVKYRFVVDMARPK